ncbi:hypothetical protein PINS_up017536 [Pythium insidiosum]|nr:hypothetical protein PINS_up017536 [Pythium insidiosum]
MRDTRKEPRCRESLDDLVGQDITQLDARPTTPPFPHPKPVIPIPAESYDSTTQEERPKDDDKESEKVEEDSLRLHRAATIIQRSWKRLLAMRSVAMLHLERIKPPAIPLGGHVTAPNSTWLRPPRIIDSLEGARQSEVHDDDCWIPKSTCGLASAWVDEELSFLEEGRRMAQPKLTLQAKMKSGAHWDSSREDQNKCVDEIDPAHEIDEGMSGFIVKAVASDIDLPPAIAPLFVEFRDGSIDSQPRFEGRSDLISIKDAIETTSLGILDSCIDECDVLDEYSQTVNGFIRLEDALREKQLDDMNAQIVVTMDPNIASNQDAETLLPWESSLSLRSEFLSVLKEFKHSLYEGSDVSNCHDHQRPPPASDTRIVFQPNELKADPIGGLIVFDRIQASSSRCLSIADDPVDKELEAMIREIQECKTQIARARWTNQALHSLPEPSTGPTD